MLKAREVPLFDADAYVVEEIEFDEVIVLDDHLPADPRLRGLSPETRDTIQAMFDGDVCEASYAASIQCKNFAHPQAWAVEVNGRARDGWKDPSRVRC